MHSRILIYSYSALWRRRTVPKCADADNIAQSVGWKAGSVFFDKSKFHCFRPAKNWVAFLRVSLSSLRGPTSRRSRSLSLARSKSSFETTSVSRCTVIHLFSVDMPTPRSSATCLRVSPLVRAIRTASCQNSSVRFGHIVHLLCCSKCYQRRGIKPRQVQTARGNKQLLAIGGGLRETAQIRREVLQGLYSWGMDAPALGIRDSAMGFWAASDEVSPANCHQHFLQHKTMNLLNCLPKLSQPNDKTLIHNIWQIETKVNVENVCKVSILLGKTNMPKRRCACKKSVRSSRHSSILLPNIGRASPLITQSNPTSLQSATEPSVPKDTSREVACCT